MGIPYRLCARMEVGRSPTRPDMLNYCFQRYGPQNGLLEGQMPVCQWSKSKSVVSSVVSLGSLTVTPVLQSGTGQSAWEVL